MEDRILAVLQEKLEHLEYQLAILTDPSQKFTLEKQISECKEEIATRTANRVDEPKELVESDAFSSFRERVKKDFGDHRLSKTKEIKLKQVGKTRGLAEKEVEKIIEQEKSAIEENRRSYQELLEAYIEERAPEAEVKKSLGEFQEEIGLKDWEVREIYQSVLNLKEDLGKGIFLEMVAIEGGNFMMGSNENDDEKPIHEVTVSSFYMGKYPVTQEQWRAIAQLEKIEIDLDPNISHFKGDKKPVDSVSWGMGVEFCKRLSRLTGKNYRLPSEAEWEYACRARTTTQYYFGDNLDPSMANYGNNLGGTSLVGRFPPNGFGLYDMHGNVWEWCLDDWHGDYNGCPTDGSAWLNRNNSQERRKLKCTRGGSWYYAPRYCRSASRLNYGLDGNHVGFRPAFSFQDSSFPFNLFPSFPSD
jgi:formylglycine-generating enzyme required for sulfatase activity